MASELNFFELDLLVEKYEPKMLSISCFVDCEYEHLPWLKISFFPSNFIVLLQLINLKFRLQR